MKIRPFSVLQAVLLAICLSFAGPGCKSTPQQVAYKSTATVSVTAEAAIRAYDVLAAQGKTTVAQNVKVKEAFQRYQASFAVLCDVGAIYAASATTNAPAAAALQQAVLNTSASISDVVTLVQLFGVKLP